MKHRKKRDGTPKRRGEFAGEQSKNRLASAAILQSENEQMLYGSEPKALSPERNPLYLVGTSTILMMLLLRLLPQSLLLPFLALQAQVLCVGLVPEMLQSALVSGLLPTNAPSTTTAVFTLGVVRIERWRPFSRFHISTGSNDRASAPVGYCVRVVVGVLVIVRVKVTAHCARNLCRNDSIILHFLLLPSIRKRVGVGVGVGVLPPHTVPNDVHVPVDVHSPPVRVRVVVVLVRVSRGVSVLGTHGVVCGLRLEVVGAADALAVL